MHCCKTVCMRIGVELMKVHDDLSHGEGVRDLQCVNAVRYLSIEDDVMTDGVVVLSIPTQP